MGTNKKKTISIASVNEILRPYIGEINNHTTRSMIRDELLNTFGSASSNITIDDNLGVTITRPHLPIQTIGDTRPYDYVRNHSEVTIDATEPNQAVMISGLYNEITGLPIPGESSWSRMQDGQSFDRTRQKLDDLRDRVKDLEAKLEDQTADLEYYKMLALEN